MEYKATVGELVALLEKLPANAEVTVLVKDETSFGGEYAANEELDLTPKEGCNPNHYSADSVECLSTQHVRITDTRNSKFIAPSKRKVTVKIGGVITK